MLTKLLGRLKKLIIEELLRLEFICLYNLKLKDNTKTVNGL